MQAAGLVKIIDVFRQPLAVAPRLEALDHRTPLPLTISGVMFISATDSRGAADLKLSHRNGSCDLRLRSSLDRLSALPILPTYLDHFSRQVTDPSVRLGSDRPELGGARGTHESASDEGRYEHLDSRGLHIITRLGTSLSLRVKEDKQ
ncbi:hypothetical protein Pst134EB_012718 [Puccinia striiformis f. sp. tritici]|uniref:Uncharacterized protein n=1 Tax=Puccinia striiformis TaxID=27350 RepID=A0A2S4VN37_9BASI|nr:hypothetical protein Pst134EB_012718 [Puccinia striiformis f. sp. tritici]POW10909.1 hypothetical protein PSTT_05637 [Puccinia striiformis]